MRPKQRAWKRRLDGPKAFAGMRLSERFWNGTRAR
jgi:hypothetical protein